jgi:hypothetical protein
MTPFECASSRFLGIEEKVLNRMILDVSLYDAKNHTLRNGITKEEARAILLLAAKAAHECGMKLVLSSDEDELMRRKFIVNGSK